MKKQWALINSNGFYLTSGHEETTLNIINCACQCHCGFKALDQVLVDKFYTLQENIPAYIEVSSGLRCSSNNCNAGGSPTSKHLFGEALDVYPSFTGKVNIEDYQIFLTNAYTLFNGIGYYNYNAVPFFHIDIRSKKTYWNCSEEGKYVYSDKIIL